MRSSKLVYSFNSDGIFVGTSVAWESWDLNGVYLIPANSTELEVPPFNEKEEYAFFNGEKWEVKNIPTKDNTPKPDHDSNTHSVFWEDDRWVLYELPSRENTPKPEYDPNVYTCDWNIDRWVLTPIPTWDSIRKKRDILLKKSDWTVMPDSNPKPSKEAWLTYRQALRDVPEFFSKPEEVVWPIEP